MISHQIEALFQRSKTTIHLLQLHSLIIKTALHHDEYRLSQFISLSSSISLQFSRTVFDNSPITPPVFAWNTMIRAYSKSSTEVESVKLLNQLRKIGLKPDKFTFPVVLKACGHCLMIGTGGLQVAFNGSLCPYMKLANEKPNSVTLVSLLGACIRILNIRLGKCIHSHIVTSGIELHVELETALLGMYAKCGHIQQAFRIFNSMGEKTLQTWTVMISGLADHGHGEEAVSLFTKMEEAGFSRQLIIFCNLICL
ncbi:hypothetical protein HAX54_049321 [Datura stramonium]|uniref:Pentatricopeptide repeat-containing protein n=1 Tax=Datura stramonium TaxID=4076 RepID=A0ABS8WKC5_DATST|nr:hypothetical protein [Datura stramonium]